MEISGVEAVLEFLRKNGLSESESALMEDVTEKTRLGSSSDFGSFLFPMVPPPPPLKIPASRRTEAAAASGEEEGGYSSGSSSKEEEFVSLLGSSTTELCSSEFTNPYGIRTTTRPSSGTSSDSLSQFGTARDYPDFNLQNDLFWYKEKDEDYLHFGGLDAGGSPSEDKFVMTAVERARRSESELSLNKLQSRKSSDDSDDGIDGKDEKGCKVYSCCSPLCACCDGARDARGGDDCIGKDSIDESFRPQGYRELPGEPDVAVDEEGVDTTDEVVTYETNADDYEVFQLRIVHRRNRTGFEESRDLRVVLDSVIAGRYYVTEYLGSAAFSKVVQARDLHTGMDVCLKIIKNDKDFFDQSLDEIKLLKFVNKHDPRDQHHVLRLYDYFYHQEHLFIVCELLCANLYEFQKHNRESSGEPYFTLARLKVITLQCLEALDFLHGLGIIHCDLKPENILIKNYKRCEIKLIDLGSSCFETDNLSLYAQSCYYRAPEVILGLPYDQKIDLWSLGCILAELASGEVLFPNERAVMLLARMVGMLGPIDVDILLNGLETDKYFTKELQLYRINQETKELEYIIPEKLHLQSHLKVSNPKFVDFVKSLLEINPQRRPTARQALRHPWLSHD